MAGELHKKNCMSIIESKINHIIEIMEIVLENNTELAYRLLYKTHTYKAIKEGDYATLYQSAACCVEDIGRELCVISSPYAEYFSNENINKALDTLMVKNKKE